jgi:hypothetical protein
VTAAAPSWKLEKRDWDAINTYVRLSDLARPDVEAAILTFRRNREYEEQKPSAELVRSRLGNVATAAQQLIEYIKQLTNHERHELSGSDFFGPDFEVEPSEFRHAHVDELLEELVDRATFLSELSTDASKYQIYPQIYSKKKVVSRPADHLVESLDRILTKHGGLTVTLANPIGSFIFAVFKCADRSVGDGSIDDAVRRFGRRRGEYERKKRLDPPEIRGGKSQRTD